MAGSRTQRLSSDVVARADVYCVCSMSTLVVAYPLSASCVGSMLPWVVVQVFTKHVRLRTPDGLKQKAWQQHVWEHYLELHRTEPGFGNPAPILLTPVEEEEDIDRVLDDFPGVADNPEIARIYLHVDKHVLPEIMCSGWPRRKFFDDGRTTLESVDLEASRLHIR